VIPVRHYLFISVQYYILCAIYLNIIEIYLYLNKLESIACYLAHKETPLISINLSFCIFYTSRCLKRYFGNKYSLKIMSIINVLLFFLSYTNPRKLTIISITYKHISYLAINTTVM